MKSELTLVTGGARSGKSRYAEALALERGGNSVLYIATLLPSDDEMARRIARHRAARPQVWRTAEAPLALVDELARAKEQVILIDCLSGFVSNLLLNYEKDGEERAVGAVLEHVSALIDTVRGSDKHVVIVSNEVGSGVVPAYKLGRWYRDTLGLANQQVAQAADRVVLMTVSIPQFLKGAPP